jgi:hypothetical protein
VDPKLRFSGPVQIVLLILAPDPAVVTFLNMYFLNLSLPFSLSAKVLRLVEKLFQQYGFIKFSFIFTDVPISIFRETLARREAVNYFTIFSDPAPPRQVILDPDLHH